MYLWQNCHIQRKFRENAAICEQNNSQTGPKESQIAVKRGMRGGSPWSVRQGTLAGRSGRHLVSADTGLVATAQLSGGGCAGGSRGQCLPSAEGAGGAAGGGGGGKGKGKVGRPPPPSPPPPPPPPSLSSSLPAGRFPSGSSFEGVLWQQPQLW